MFVHVLRFFQRYALFFSASVSIIVRHLIVPDDWNKWLGLAATVLVFLAVYKLLYKDGVTGCREGDKPGMTMLALIGFTLGYLYLLAMVLIIITLDCKLATDSLGECIDEQKGWLILSVCIAAVLYGRPFGIGAECIEA